MTALEPDVLARYGERQIPRYTSYPTAPNFRPVEEEQYRDWLRELDTAAPLSLYVHVPFCRSMCWYCGCNTTVSARHAPISRYLAALAAELALVAAALPSRMRVAHLHFGGGTPTMMRPGEFLRLMGQLRERFDFAPDAELAIEIDPRTLEPDMITALAKGGINRASLGVQSFDPAVQQAINRVQSFAETEAAVRGLRAAGIAGLNFDLIYGLPHQTVESCRDTVAQALKLRPDRLAVFGYAHVPSFKLHQRKIDSAALPGGAERLAQAQAIADALVAAGYVEIGLDHYALPDDELARAAGTGALRRNFQGYTTDSCTTLIGLGASSIGRLPSGYVQNRVLIGDYQAAVLDGRLPAAKGCPISADDALRAAVIERIMCDHRVDLREVSRPFGAEPAAFADPLRLEPLQADGLIDLEGDVLTIRPAARPLVRAVAAAFDAYLDPSGGRHARAV